MSTGRSPYPSRNRRRPPSIESSSSSSGAVATNGGGGATTSPLLMSNLLSTSARLSSPTSFSPTAVPVTTRTTRSSRRFFDSADRSRDPAATLGGGGGTRGGGGGGSNHHNKTTTTTTTNNNTPPPRPEQYPETTSRAASSSLSLLDGIPLDKLRVLTAQCLTSSPSTAVFYASLVHSKTQSPSDALRYAEALHHNHEDRRCVGVLQQHSLLILSSSSSSSSFSSSSLLATTRQQPSQEEEEDAILSNSRYRNIALQAVWLATRALARLGEWLQILQLLDELIVLEQQQQQLLQQQQQLSDNHQHNLNSTNDKDEDKEEDAAWMALAKENNNHGEKEHSNSATPAAVVASRLCWIKGRAHDETGHPVRAALYWKRALRLDPTFVQALDALLERHFLSPQETYDLVMSLDLKQGEEYLRRLYLARIHVPPQQGEGAVVAPLFAADASSIYHAPGAAVSTPHVGGVLEEEDGHKTDENNHKMQATANSNNSKALQLAVDDAFDKLWSVHKLQRSPEALALAAIRSYRQYDLPKALEYCQELRSIDPLCPRASLVHVATLLALQQTRVLFGLAHEWVEAAPKSAPKSARSWFAVGAYYYACGRYHVAQKHFCRATRLDPHCPEVWIAFGCAFAVCDESDQALASFRAAQRLAPAQHTPLLYMGMEYLRTNHLVLAQHFLTAAHKASGGDPLCLHELGVAAYQRCDYNTAIVWFTRTLQACRAKREVHDGGPMSARDAIQNCQDAFWEPALFNLGHCYRRTRQFEEAALCFEKCLALCPGSASSFSAWGFTKHLEGDIDGAIELYHQALSRKPDDPFSSEMLNRALEEALATSLKVDMESVNTRTGRSVARASVAFRSPLADSSNDDMDLSRGKRRTRDPDLSIATDDGPSFSLDSSEDVDMSIS